MPQQEPVHSDPSQQVTDRPLGSLGPLRLALLAFVALCSAAALFNDAEPHGWGIFPAYIAPVFVVLFFFLLLLDALMNRVFMTDQTGAVQDRHRFIIRVDLIAVAVMTACWAPFFLAILDL